MSNVLVHAAVGVPFALAGEWGAALCCVIHDLTWLPHEWRYRRSGVRPWPRWAGTPGALLPGVLLAYRLTHSWALAGMVFALLAFAGVPSWGLWALAYYAHLTLDLFTHYGELAQRPLYPFNNWRWPWPIRIKT